MSEWDDDTMVGVEEFLALTSTKCLGQVARLQKSDPTMPRPVALAGDVLAFDREEVSQWMSARIDRGLSDFFGLSDPSR